MSKTSSPAAETRTGSQGSSQSWLRQSHERLILSLLRSNGPTAKADIARITGLSAQSASVITRRLEEDGLIERGTPIRGKVGQPSIPLRLAPEGALFYGLKIGRRSTDLLLVDFFGQAIDGAHRTHRYPDPENTLNFVQSAVADLNGRLTQSRRDAISGMGISLPGYLWEWAETIGEPMDKMAAWRHRDIRADIDQVFDFPVFLQNDASCACGAELVFGQPDYPREFLYFYIGYFVGGGLVLNNQLFTGPTGNAGALGPMPVSIRGQSVQQLIEIASLSGLEQSIVNAGGNGQILWESNENWSIDPQVLSRWLDQAAEGLAYAIVASCSLIDFERVVIDGWLPRPLLGDLVQLTAKKLNQFELAGLIPPQITQGTIGADARSVGAASLPLSQRFMISQRG